MPYVYNAQKKENLPKMRFLCKQFIVSLLYVIVINIVKLFARLK